jgi:hypothetical protein
MSLVIVEPVSNIMMATWRKCNHLHILIANDAGICGICGNMVPGVCDYQMMVGQHICNLPKESGHQDWCGCAILPGLGVYQQYIDFQEVFDDSANNSIQHNNHALFFIPLM